MIEILREALGPAYAVDWLREDGVCVSRPLVGGAFVWVRPVPAGTQLVVKPSWNGTWFFGAYLYNRLVTCRRVVRALLASPELQGAAVRSR